MCVVALKLILVIAASTAISGILLALYLFLTTPENKKMFKEIKDLFKEGK